MRPLTDFVSHRWWLDIDSRDRLVGVVEVVVDDQIQVRLSGLPRLPLELGIYARTLRGQRQYGGAVPRSRERLGPLAAVLQFVEADLELPLPLAMVLPECLYGQDFSLYRCLSGVDDRARVLAEELHDPQGDLPRGDCAGGSDDFVAGPVGGSHPEPYVIPALDRHAIQRVEVEDCLVHIIGIAVGYHHEFSRGLSAGHRPVVPDIDPSDL